MYDGSQSRIYEQSKHKSRTSNNMELINHLGINLTKIIRYEKNKLPANIYNIL